MQPTDDTADASPPVYTPAGSGGGGVGGVDVCVWGGGACVRGARRATH
jgi:hypothetical protein